MSVYLKSDLNNANNALSILEKDISDANSLIEAINSFQNDTQKSLIGKGWDLIRSSLDEYIQALKIRINNCKSLIEIIKNANNSIIFAMGSNEKIDTGQLEELKNIYNRSLKLNQDIDNNLDEKEKQTNQNLMMHIKEMIAQIENVQNAENVAINQLNSLSRNDDSYKNKIDSITTKNII